MLSILWIFVSENEELLPWHLHLGKGTGWTCCLRVFSKTCCSRAWRPNVYKFSSEMNAFESPQILSIASWVFCIGIIAPIEIFWFWTFWKRRKNPFISKRRPKMLLFQLLAFWICQFLLFSYWIMFSFYDDLVLYSSFVTLGNVVRHVGETVFVAISISRSWLLFFS